MKTGIRNVECTDWKKHQNNIVFAYLLFCKIVYMFYMSHEGTLFEMIKAFETDWRIKSLVKKAYMLLKQVQNAKKKKLEKTFCIL